MDPLDKMIEDVRKAIRDHAVPTKTFFFRIVATLAVYQELLDNSNIDKVNEFCAQVDLENAVYIVNELGPRNTATLINPMDANSLKQLNALVGRFRDRV